jgi:hypothetical protein
MKNRMSPVRAGFSVGFIAGTVLAIIILVISVNRVSDGTGALLDAMTAFVIGGVIAGGLGAFVQSRRLAASTGGAAPPGWYDSPEDDGTQWYWSGSKWTDRTRTAPERIRRIDSTY